MRNVSSLAMIRLTLVVAIAGALTLTAALPAQAVVTRQQARTWTLNYAKRNCATNRSCRKYAENACIHKDNGQRCLAWNYDSNKRKGKYTLKRVILWHGPLQPEFLTKWNSYEGWALGPPKAFRFAISR
jgi:uncharacterized low-complexity protein